MSATLRSIRCRARGQHRGPPRREAAWGGPTREPRTRRSAARGGTSRFAWLPSALTALATLGLLASLTGCGDSIAWIAQPTGDPVWLDPPIELSSGEFVSSGFIRKITTTSETQAALVKLAADGEVRQTRVYNARWIQVDLVADDQLAFVGDFYDASGAVETRTGLMGSEGDEQWSLPFPGVMRVGPLDANSYYACGATVENGFISVLGLDGTLGWTYTIDKKEYSSLVRPNAAARASNGDVLLTGWTGEEFEFLASFVTRLDPAGEPLWTRTFDATRISDIAVDPASGSAYFTGNSNGHLVIGALDADGDDLFFDVDNPESTPPYTDLEFGMTIAVRAAASAGSTATEILVAGRVAEDPNFGLGPPIWDSKAFLFVMDTEGEPIWRFAVEGPSANMFVARWAEDGSILAALSLYSEDWYTGVARVAGHDIPIRGYNDTALMQIRR